MEIPENLLCLFSAEVEAHGDSYRIEVPARELTLGELRESEMYRIALLESAATPTPQTDSGQQPEQRDLEPPIAEGDRRTVEIEEIGERGDGIARVERGYVIIVPDTEIGDRVTIEIRNVQKNLAFGEVIEHKTSDWEE